MIIYNTDGKMETLNVGEYMTQLENVTKARKSFDDLMTLYLALHQLKNGTVMVDEKDPNWEKVVKLLDAGMLCLGCGGKEGLTVSIRSTGWPGVQTLTQAHLAPNADLRQDAGNDRTNVK